MGGVIVVHKMFTRFSFDTRRLLVLLALVLLNYDVLAASEPAVNSKPPARHSHAQWFLEQPYNQWYRNIRDNPNAVLQAIVQAERESDPPAAMPSATAAVFQQLVKAHAYIALVYPEQAIQAVNQGLALIESSNAAEHERQALFHRLQLAKAMAFDLSGKASQGLALALATKSWAEEHDPQMLTDVLMVEGALYISLADYVQAYDTLLHAYQRAPRTSRWQAPWNAKGDVASLIALVFEYRGQPKLTQRYFVEAVSYHREMSHRLELSIALYGLARANQALGELSIAEAQFRESWQLAEAIGDRQGVAYSMQELAGVLMARQDFAAAQPLLWQALAAFQEANNPYMQFGIYLKLSQVALATDDLKLAEEHFRQAQALLDPENMPEHALQAREFEARLLAANQQFAKAYEVQLSVLNERRQRAREQSFQKLQDVYNAFLKRQEENEAELQNLELQRAQERQRFMVTLVIGLALVVSLLLLMLYRGFRYRQQLQRLASADDLTGALNRRAIYQQLATQLAAMARNAQPLSVVLMDLDHFKAINDQFGHPLGDKVLQRFAATVRRHLRQSDALGRVGGEEFMLVLPHTDLSGAEHLLARLLADIQGIARQLNQTGLSVSCSAGIGEWSNLAVLEGYDPQQLVSVIEQGLKQVDEQLYCAKRNGRNQYQSVSIKVNA